MFLRTTFLILIILACSQAHANDALWALVAEVTRVPAGWIDFCKENPKECPTGATEPRDIVLNEVGQRDLLKVNRWVNETIKPMSDMDHWGVIDKWSIPTDGYGDCEDKVLLKRKMLIDAGWLREALLFTIVLDKDGDGHAILTVKTDKGEFILTDQSDEVMLWSKAVHTFGYRFVKRQSQSDPNVWVRLGLSEPADAAAAPASKHEDVTSN